MDTQRRHLVAGAAAAALFASLCMPVTAQSPDFPPKKPVTLVVGFAAGGAADAAARLIAKKLAENIGQTVVVDNKAGAGGNIAHQIVAKAPADGSVLLFGSVGPLTIAPHLMKLPYDPFKDLAPVSGGVSFPNVLVVHPGLNVKTLQQFVELAKAKSVDYASTGAGSASHLAGELFNQRAGVEMVHVPYKGGAPHGTAAGRGRAADSAGHHGPRAAGLHAQHPHRGRIGLSGFRGAQLVRLRRARQDTGAAAGPLEPGDREGAGGPRRA